ncbi:MAG: GDP-L-fucose synthase [Gammaproteobacteria bacterium]|nr:GDP-L-fucose synthase [Gammaproteobacteria bacterium]MCF6261896.1 GDP-L-fucose synthase [Gammaproteobacteria bacterium]
MNECDKIYVAGHRGLVGAAICRVLEKQGFGNIAARTRGELDLTNQSAVLTFFEAERPDYVFLAAARVGGIHANNSYPAEFIRDNLLIQTNIIDAAYQNGTRKLQLLGSSCIYPKLAPQPMKEEHLLTGELEPTNEWYAVAKIAGIKQCQAYRRQYGFDAISLMPTNLYGMGDNFDLENSHVVPALLRKFHEAKVSGADNVQVWGSGNPRREFLHVDDLADAAVYLMKNYSDESIVNVGVGEDVSIRELAELIARVVEFEGELCFDASKPDGAPRKLLDVSKLNDIGWRAKINLGEGLSSTYQWFLDNQSTLRV